MSMQEEIIAKRKLELLEKQKTAELAKQVQAAQSGKYVAIFQRQFLYAYAKMPISNLNLCDFSGRLHRKKSPK